MSMTDWKAKAAAANPPVPDEILDQVIPPLEALEAAFRPLERAIPPDALAWNGPDGA
jgi:hypothetical protein